MLLIRIRHFLAPCCLHFRRSILNSFVLFFSTTFLLFLSSAGAQQISFYSIMALTLSVLTLNIWGIPIVSKDKDIRVKHIADKFAQSDYDIISLQEVWSEYDYVKIKERVSSQFPFSHYFYSGVVGSGLCIFSRYKIISTFFHHWSVNGYVHKIQHGDWFGGKGVGMCKIKIQEHVINFYLAHVRFSEFIFFRFDLKCFFVLSSFMPNTIKTVTIT